MCAAIAVRGTELFTSSSSSSILLVLLILYCILSFLVVLISSSAIFPFCLSLIHALASLSFYLLCSLCLLLLSFPPSTALPPLTLLLFLTPLTTPTLHSFSPSLLSLSLSSTVSPEASLSHHSSSFINTCTHTAQHAQLPHIPVRCSHKHAYTHSRAHACRLHKCPSGCEEPSVSTHSHPLTVQKNALCKRTGSINLWDASACTMMLFRILFSLGFPLIALYCSYYCTLVIGSNVTV